MNGLRVALADDSGIFRAGLAALPTAGSPTSAARRPRLAGPSKLLSSTLSPAASPLPTTPVSFALGWPPC